MSWRSRKRPAIIGTPPCSSTPQRPMHLSVISSFESGAVSTHKVQVEAKCREASQIYIYQRSRTDNRNGDPREVQRIGRINFTAANPPSADLSAILPRHRGCHAEAECFVAGKAYAAANTVARCLLRNFRLEKGGSKP